MRAGGHAHDTQPAHRITTAGVNFLDEGASTDRRPSSSGGLSAESAQALPLSVEDVPAALSALLDHARHARGPVAPWTGGILHALRTERATVIEAAMLDAGVGYVSLTPKVVGEAEAAALWTRTARALSLEYAAEVRRIERTGVAGGTLARARAAVWDARVGLLTALYEEIGVRS